MNLTKNTSMRNICETILQNAINITEGQSGVLFLLDTNEKVTPLCSINTVKELPLPLVRRAIDEKRTVILTQDDVNDFIAKETRANQAKRPMKLGAQQEKTSSRNNNTSRRNGCCCGRR